MQIKVFAPAFISHAPIDEDGYIFLENGATLKNLCQELKVPLIYRVSLFYVVNYDHVGINTKLKDGDIVSFIFPFSGG